jgi:hypothetical protein
MPANVKPFSRYTDKLFEDARELYGKYSDEFAFLVPNKMNLYTG